MVTLFASARPVYRKCGFELAGSETIYEAETSALPFKTDLVFRRIGLDDPLLPRAYDAKTADEASLLDRTERHWREIRRARATPWKLMAPAMDSFRPMLSSMPAIRVA